MRDWQQYKSNGVAGVEYKKLTTNIKRIREDCANFHIKCDQIIST